MSHARVIKWALAGALVAGGAVLFCGCEGEEGGLTPPEVQYRDQTFSLLVCDGNGNASTGERATNWDRDGAAVVTLDWNGDGAGPNRLPVTYIYDGEYPAVLLGCFFVPSLRLQRDPEIVERLVPARTDPHGLPELRDRLLVPS